MIRTIDGDVEDVAVGFTLIHEHLCMRTPAVAENFPAAFDREAVVRRIVDELTRLRSLGVQCIVDHTTFDLGRDVRLLEEVSRASGMTIVAVTGLWRDRPRFFRGPRSPEELTALFEPDVTTAMAGGASRAGVVKLSVEAAEPNAVDVALAQSAAQLSLRTGVPISSHTSSQNRSGIPVLRLLLEAGVAPERILIGHCGDTDDDEYVLEIARAGAFVGIDRFGLVDLRPDRGRLRTVLTLLEAGFGDRVMLSADAAIADDRSWPADLSALRTDWDLAHVPTRVLPALAAEGVDANQLRQMTIHNPRRFLALAVPAADSR